MLLEHVGLRDLCRFLAVSKSWYDAIENLRSNCLRSNCYLIALDESLAIYSSLHEKGNRSMWPSPATGTDLVASSNGLLFFYNHVRTRKAAVYHVLKHKYLEVPAPPVLRCLEGIYGDEGLLFLGLQTGQELGATAAFILVCVRWNLQPGELSQTVIQVFTAGDTDWETSVLQLEVGEEFVTSDIVGSFSLHGSVLYFLTVKRQETCVKSIDVLKKGCQSKTLATWTELPFGLLNKCSKNKYPLSIRSIHCWPWWEDVCCLRA